MDLSINGQTQVVDDAQVDPRMPLLWLLRDVLQLTGTKYGCGVAACGACTVHVDGRAQRACVMTVASVADKHVTTIEGLASGDTLHPVQAAWIEADVPQCGYCQAGQIMAAVDLLQRLAVRDLGVVAPFGVDEEFTPHQV